MYGLSRVVKAFKQPLAHLLCYIVLVVILKIFICWDLGEPMLHTTDNSKIHANKTTPLFALLSK